MDGKKKMRIDGVEEKVESYGWHCDGNDIKGHYVTTENYKLFYNLEGLFTKMVALRELSSISWLYTLKGYIIHIIDSIYIYVKFYSTKIIITISDELQSRWSRVLWTNGKWFDAVEVEVGREYNNERFY